MNNEVFDQYTNKVCKYFGLSGELLFSKVKRQRIVDARHLLYYLCYTHGMSMNYIRDYMEDNGYYTPQSNVFHGIKRIERCSEDDPFKSIILELK